MLNLTLHIPVNETDGMLPPKRILDEAAGRGVQNLIIRHLRGKGTNRRGFPSSGYWADAARSVSLAVNGGAATVEIAKEGVALHYEGGTVLPKDGGKALAIPLAAGVYGRKPSEWSGFRRGDEPDGDDVLQLFWPKNSSHGFLKDRDSGELLYLLVRSARIPRDPDTLPSEADMFAAAGDAIGEVLA